MIRRRTIATVLVLALLAGGALAGSAQAAGGVPHIRHVFIIVLENENAEQTFGPDSPAPYLAQKLPAKGVLVPGYYAIGHVSLDNYIAMISGQAPNPQTQADCLIYNEFVPGTPTANGQVLGSGCAYPSPAVQTIANQLDDVGLTWKGYMEDMAAKAPAEPSSCRHPAVGSFDDTQSAEVGDQYAARHNPFVYFHSITDYPTCAENDVDLNRLPADLEKAKRTANYNFITPNLCNDGHDAPCVDGRPGGLEQANQWLRKQVPEILRSPAYRRHGLLIVTFDEAESTGSAADSSSCCGERSGPNTPSPGGLHPGPGGGRVGAVMLSPCIRGGTTTGHEYNHYSMLRSIEDNFGLPRLGFAAQPGLRTFGGDIFTRPGCQEHIHLRVRPHGVRLDRRQTFRFRVRSRFHRCRAHVLVKLIARNDPRRPRGALRRARTDRHGRAEVRAKIRKRGALVARANKAGCISTSTPIRIR